MTKVKKKSPAEREYDKQVKRIKQFVRKAEKRGFIFPDNVIPSKPKRITKASVRKLAKITPKELYKRFKKQKCELCGKEDTNVKVHQVASLKDLNNNFEWEMIMKNKNRKTLIVCNECHRLITSKM